MRLKEISTLAGAGILSLIAVLVLESEKDGGTSTSEAATAVDFEDTSSLVEYSLPAPTAEPPSKDGESGALEAPPTGALASLSTPLPAADDAGEIPADLPDGAVPPASPQAEGPGEPSSLSDTFLKAVASATDGGAPGQAAPSTDEQPSIIEETPDGFWLKSAKLNDVFQHLAQIGNFQYFHNNEIDGPNFVVTGQLMNDAPLKQMEELALMYGITIHQKGNTVYALNSAQLTQLPTEPFRYQLRYLRPKDIEQIKLILQPFLTPGSGIIEFEPKTNTLIVMDNVRKLDALAVFLNQIDQPKQQIAIETRILRVTNNVSKRVGVDWESVLGTNGTTISAAGSLNALFNLPDLATAASFITSTDDGNNLTTSTVDAGGTFRTAGQTGSSGGLVLSPVQLSVVLRALNAGGLAQQESSPTLIAEDNEEGLISIIDRIPIITSTVTISDGSQNITEEVRYKIDEEDAAGDPNTTREVGVSVSVTPTILPDNTIRMSLRPRSAQVTEYVTAPSGNLYPRVNESTVTTTARVPNGHSLLIGGFYEEIVTENQNKVPLLGDIPAVNLLFKSSNKEKKNTSLVFIVTPKLYRPNAVSENDIISHEIHQSHILPTNHDYADRDSPGNNHRPNLRNTIDNTYKRYEPDAPSNLLLPEHPYNRPEALPTHGKRDDDEPRFAPVGNRPEVTVRPAGKKNGNLFKGFGGKKKR